MDGNDSVTDDCIYSKGDYLEFRFYFVFLGGNLVAICSLLENCVSVYLLVSRSRFRCRYTYLAWLAASDVVVAVCYMALMPTDVLAQWLPSLWLFELWHAYLLPLLAITHSAATAGAFLISCATFQRYFITTGRARPYQFMQSHRIAMSILSVLLSLLFRGTTYLELVIVRDTNCTGFAAVYPFYSDLARNRYYRIWMYWVRNVATVFLPFVALTYCNVIVVMTLKSSLLRDSPRTSRCRVGSKGSPTSSNRDIGRPPRQFFRGTIKHLQKRRDTQQSRSSIRSATRMMILIVFTYFLSNILNIVVTVWEFVDPSGLQTRFAGFYALSSDIESLLRVFAGALRLPIYVLCNEAIRDELLITFRCRFFRQCGSSHNLLNGTVVKFVAVVAATSAVSNDQQQPLSSSSDEAQRVQKYLTPQTCEFMVLKGSFKRNSSASVSRSPSGSRMEGIESYHSLARQRIKSCVDSLVHSLPTASRNSASTSLLMSRDGQREKLGHRYGTFDSAKQNRTFSTLVTAYSGSNNQREEAIL